jgi:hypothetical protein
MAGPGLALYCQCWHASMACSAKGIEMLVLNLASFCGVLLFLCDSTYSPHPPGAPVRRSLKRRAAAVMRMAPDNPDPNQQSQSSSEAGEGGSKTQAAHDGAFDASTAPPPPAPWDALYVARCVRTARGACGYLHRAWPGPWRLYALPQGG